MSLFKKEESKEITNQTLIKLTESINNLAKALNKYNQIKVFEYKLNENNKESNKEKIEKIVETKQKSKLKQNKNKK